MIVYRFLPYRIFPPHFRPSVSRRDEDAGKGAATALRDPRCFVCQEISPFAVGEGQYILYLWLVYSSLPSCGCILF